MSAICGVVRRNGTSLAPNAVESMMRRMAAFGPDGSGRWQSGSAALGHLRLCVTPESRHERLPLTEGRVVLVADARLDNRSELFSALGTPEGDTSRVPDAWLLMRSYLRWGEDCLHHLEGDFAFSLWDEERRLLVCARDAMGARPFYYHLGPDTLAFATSQRALLDVPGVSWELDELALADELTANWGEDLSATFFASIRRLPPAHMLVVCHGEFRVRRYWTPDLHREVRFPRDDDYVAAYRDHLENAVRDRLRTSGRVASFLSGGLDSSAVAGLAARELAREGKAPLITYSNVLSADTPGAAGDERPLVEAVLREGSPMEGHFITSAGKSMVRSVVGARCDACVPGAGTQFLSEAAAAAQQSGARVLLDGSGGDQAATSAGGGALQELLFTGRWLALGRLARASADARGRSTLRIAGGAMVDVFAGLTPGLVSRLRPSHRVARVLERRASVSRYVARDLADRTRLTERVENGSHFGQMTFQRLRDRQWRMLSRWGPERSTEATHPEMAYHRVERTLPMLDRRLVEYCLAVPCEQHAGPPPRALVRRATAGLLPDVVRLRQDKSHAAIPAPTHYVAGDPEELRTALYEMRGEPIVQAFVDVERLEQTLLVELPQDLDEGGRSATDLNTVQRAFRTGCFLAWFARERREKNMPTL